MSIKAMNWAWEQRTGNPGLKMVLLKLADNADDIGFSYPSVAYIADLCEVSERTAQRHIRTLQEKQLLTIEKRVRSDGSTTSNGYTLSLHMEAPARERGRGVKLSPAPGQAAECHARGDTDGVKGCQTEGGAGDTGDTQTTNQPSENHQMEPPSGAACGQPELVFPAGMLATDRMGAAAVLRGLDADLAQATLDELAARMTKTGVRSPIGYLRSLVKAARRGQFKPDLGPGHAADRAVRNLNLQRLQRRESGHGGRTLRLWDAEDG